MGKGAGCCPSKKRQPRRDSPPLSMALSNSAIDTDGTGRTSAEATAAAADALISQDTLKIFIVYYSMYGHIEALAKKMKEGVDSVEGVQGCLFRVPETLSCDVLERMQARPKDESIPVISAAELPAADGLVFGFPTRFGAMATQMKAFFDSTGQLWQAQQLAGKPAGVFVSTGTQGGGQEATAWTAITQLVHHGMLFVPIGYTFGAGMFKMDEIKGGSPYGAGTYSGDGTRIPSDLELAVADHQGRYMAAVVKRLVTA
eukprot:c25876_g1_i2 orf=420-1193(-)